MKGKIKLFVLLTLFVSAVACSFVINGVNSNAAYVSGAAKQFAGNEITYDTNIEDSAAYNVFNQTSFSVELYVKDFVPGTSSQTTLFTAGDKDASGNSHGFEIRYGKSSDEVAIYYWNGTSLVGHILNFNNAFKNLQDDLISVTVDTSTNYLRVYLNGALLTELHYADHIKKLSGIDFVKFGDGTGMSKCITAARFYSKKLSSAEVKQNYETDYDSFSKKKAAGLPSWKDYDTASNNLKGYFAGQDPLITGYNQIASQSNYLSDNSLISNREGRVTDQLNMLKNKPYNCTWQNLADLTHSMGIWNSIDFTVNADKKIKSYKGSYVDEDGYHLNSATNTLFRKNEFTDYTASQDTDFTQNIFCEGKGFTIEMFIGDFDSSVSATHNMFFVIPSVGGTAYDSSHTHTGDSEVTLFYNRDTHALSLKYPTTTGGMASTRTYLDLKLNGSAISSSQLQDCLLTVVWNNGGTALTVYYNGTKVGEKTGSSDAVRRPHWNQLQIGSSNTGRYINATYRCVRVYNAPLTQSQVQANYARDVLLYKRDNVPAAQMTAPTKQTTSYGLCGFDKIFENGSIGVAKEIKFIGSNLTNENGVDGYVNELLNDWEPATGLYVSKAERLKYYVASLNDGLKDSKLTYARTPVRIDQRATLYDMQKYVNGSDYFKGREENSEQIINSAMETAGFTTASNGALLIQDNFYMRSKYKCGDSSVVTNANHKITDSTKLMATADIKTITLRDTDFCGMVIDYSDEVWNRYAPDADYLGNAWSGHDRNDSMNTHFDSESSEHGYSRTSLFETGVGFNLIRKATEFDSTLGGNESDYMMRVFVGGDGSANSTTYMDLALDAHDTVKNFTMYREYTTWPFASTTGLKTSSNATWNLTKGETNVYLVKYYVNKKMVAIVVMGLGNSTTITDTPLAGATGYIIKVNDNGTLDIATAVKTKCTFKDWRQKCHYGMDGAYVENTASDDRNASASGNILFAVHREHLKFLNDSGDGIQMCSTEEDLCRIVIDNIGYMDYHDKEYTQKTYTEAYAVSQDMTLNIATSLVYARKVFEPDIYFNRLGYDRSLEKFSDMGKTAYNAALSDPDFKASHGKTKLSNGYFQLGDTSSNITMYTNSVDGIYFKDIADKITYDFVDFNGETMFTLEMKAIDYFTTLYKLNKGTDAEKAELFEELRITELPEALTLTDNQICLMVDLIELGKAHSDYAKYWKLAGQFEGQEIGTLADFAIVSGNAPDFDTSSDIGSTYAKGLIDAKPTKISTGNDKTSQAFFKSFALSIKSYVSLLVKVQVPNTWTSSMADHFKVYYAGEGGTKGAAYNLVYYNPDDINAYHDGEVYKHEAIATVEPIEGTSSSYVTIEIKLSILDFDKQFYFELKDGSNVNSTYVYGLYDYCLSKWDNSDRTLSEFVRRAFHIGELAQYYDGSKGTFELWKNHV